MKRLDRWCKSWTLQGTSTINQVRARSKGVQAADLLTSNPTSDWYGLLVLYTLLPDIAIAMLAVTAAFTALTGASQGLDHTTEAV